jgi:hypothetical protein
MSPYAAEGTAAHELLEDCIKAKADPAKYEGKPSNGIIVDRGMADAVTVATDWFWALEPDWHESEMEVMIPELDLPGHPGQGHIDLVAVKAGILYVIDYKHGQGVGVSAEGNPQLMLYALGALRWLRGPMQTKTIGALSRTINAIKLVIIQPRLRGGEPITLHDLPLKALDKFVGTVGRAVKAIREESTVRHAGEEQCHFCRAAGTCEEFARTAIDAAKLDFADVLDGEPGQQPAAGTMSIKDLGACLSAVPLITAWVKAIEAEVTTRLMNGQPVPGFKLVEGRSVRKWADEAALHLGLMTMPGLTVDQYAPRKLVGVTEMSKILPMKPAERQAWIDGMTTRAPGKPVVARADDKRPAMDPASVADTFDDLIEPDL